ncbi:junctophilin-1-like isoform X2 [Wyeomyia smithii]|uniref:junctophilin-1-like isoform X2 n=1 Tax=Wyeomyia smithii TaxID=174621 RepID=UPI00246821D3|nr:junctophilin-1-like isoform X2 [Wyeomyia smithii]
MASSVSQQGVANSAGLNGNQKICGGRYDFEDGGTFCGGWEDNKAHGHGVCTGPKNQGAYFGAWHYGFEVSGVYIWPSGSSYEGHWQNGKRHGLGVETRGRWIYRGEWTQGFKGRYGVRQSISSTARYEGTWANGLQDGYGSETYADGGSYQGQWLRGMRHGYGVRTSAPFGMAARFRTKNIRVSMTSIRSNDGNSNQIVSSDAAEKRNHRIDDARGGFVLKARSDEPPARRNSLVEKTKKGLLSGLKIRKQRSTGDLEKRGAGSGSIRSTASIASWLSTESSQSGMTNKSMHTDSNASFIVEDEQLDGSVTETYMGEWKNDKRCGYGISERSDGLKYEGEWFSNKKYGYGVTTFKDGTKEEGKYKNNVLITSQKKRHLFLIRSAKFRERIDAAIDSAQRASKYALQKADIAISRTATARGKAELADVAADQAREDSDISIQMAKEFAPDFKPQLLDRFERLKRDRCRLDYTIKATPIEPSKPKTGENISKQHQFNQVPTGSSLQPQIQQSNFNHDISSDFYDNGYPSSQQPISSLNAPIKPSTRKSSQTLERNNQQSSANISNIANNVQSTLMTPSKLVMQAEILSNQQRQLDSNYSDRQNFQQLELERYQHENITRNSIQTSSLAKPAVTLSQSNQTSIDYFDHYKRPPSRDGSVDRYSRAASRLGGTQSRQSSVDRTGQYYANQANANDTVPDRSIRAGSQIRGVTLTQNVSQNNSSMHTGNGVGLISQTRAASPFHQPSSDSNRNQPFEEVLLRQRTLGQDIIPSLSQPKRTESLYLSKSGGLQNESVGAVGVSIAMSKGGRGALGAGSGNGMLRAPKIFVVKFHDSDHSVPHGWCRCCSV